MSCVFFLRVEFLSLIENLFFSGYCIKYISFFIYHTQVKLLLVDRANGETRFGTAELCTFDGFYLACERGGGVDYIVNVASRYTDMLEVVDTLCLRRRLSTRFCISSRSLSSFGV